MIQQRLIAGWLATAALAACATAGVPSPTETALPGVSPAAETAPTIQSDANSAVLIPRASGDGLILGSSENAGIELYGLDGARVSTIAAGATVGIDARFGAPSQNAWTVAALDGAANRLRLFEVDAENRTGRERTVRDIPVGFGGESLCLYRDARDATLYAFVLGGGGGQTRMIGIGLGDH